MRFPGFTTQRWYEEIVMYVRSRWDSDKYGSFIKVSYKIRIPIHCGQYRLHSWEVGTAWSFFPLELAVLAVSKTLW